MHQNNPYSDALTQSRQKFSQCLPQEVARIKKVSWDAGPQVFTLPFLNESYQIAYPSGHINKESGGEDVNVILQILILHYLTGGYQPLKNQWITFKELPGGNIYLQPFLARAVRPVVKAFGSCPRLLLDAGRTLGGRPLGLGDASVVLYPFPEIPVAYIVWAGDEEFPPNATVLFDASASGFMPTEDYAVLGEILAGYLKRAAASIAKKDGQEC
ncbi:MAG: hypothetical protein PWP65_1019 [Clostridia bacterium]|nr:hypothetical protein [Clostridia bacterium]